MSPTYILSRQRASYHSTKFQRRPYTARSTQGAPNPKSNHARLYSDTFPAMIPVFLLGSAVYLGLQLIQLKISHEKYMEDAASRVLSLEAEIEALQQQRAIRSYATSNPPPNDNEKKTSRWSWF